MIILSYIDGVKWGNGYGNSMVFNDDDTGLLLSEVPKASSQHHVSGAG